MQVSILVGNKSVSLITQTIELICRIRCIRIYACGVLHQTKVASAKSARISKNKQDFIVFYKVLARCFQMNELKRQLDVKMGDTKGRAQNVMSKIEKNKRTQRP